MTRIGINPARGKTSDYRPARVTLALLTYLPHLEGYFRSRFDILRLCIASILENTSFPYDFLVFDNGSCSSVVDYLTQLKNTGKIDYLLLSRVNIGKIGAFRLLFGASPGELIAYSDDDIFFYPGWLEAHINILDTFPKVGMVSGSPVRDYADRARTSLDRLIKEHPPRLSVSRDRRVQDEWEIDWAKSVGRDPDIHLKSTLNQTDLIVEYEGVEAYGSASHFQFVAPKELLLQALLGAWSGKLMGDMISLDEAVDQQGFLRLSTTKRTTRHLGNAISSDLVELARGIGLEIDHDYSLLTHRHNWIMKVPGTRRIARGFYNYLFEILHNFD